jgi:hypothetical protein
MANIDLCEQIKRRIENNSNFQEYFNGDAYSTFYEESSNLTRCRNCYDNLINVKTDMVDINLDNRINEKVIYEMEILSKQQYIATKKKYEDDIKVMILNNENKIEEKNQQNELKRLELEKKQNLLDEEIKNLKIQIEKIKEQNENEIDYQKKNKLNKIKNYYKLKLVKYQNEKDKENMKALALIEVKKKNFEVQKELEINDMKNKSLLIQELIAIFKTTLINN